MAKLPDLDLGEFGGQALPDLDLAEFAAPLAKPIQTSAIGEVARGVGRGVLDVPKMLAGAIQTAIRPSEDIETSQGLKTGNYTGRGVYDYLGEVVKQAEKYQQSESLKAHPDQHGAIVNTLAEGAQAIPPSLAPMLVPGVGPLLAAGIGGATFGASQAQQDYEQARAAGKSHDEAVKISSMTGGIEAGGETVGEYALLKLFNSFGGGKAKAAKEAFSRFTDPKWLKTYGIDWAKNAAIQSATEFGQGAGESAVKQAYGVGDNKPIEEGVHGAVVAGAMSLLLGPFAGYGHYKDSRQRALSADLLQNPPVETDQEKQALITAGRAQAAKNVYAELKQADPAAADDWYKSAIDAISKGKAVNLDEGFAANWKQQQPTSEPAPAPTENPSTFQEFSDFADSIDAELEARRNTLAAPTNFGKVDEFANFVQQEKADVEAQRGLISQRQGVMRESSLESADARVTGQRIAETRTGRLNLLDEVYASGDRTPGMTFLKKLEAEYPNQPLPTPEEKAIIANRESAYQGFTQPDIESSLPNELVMPEPGKPKQGQKFDRSILIRKLLSTKGNRVKGDAIVNKDGKPILKSVTQDELTGAEKYGQAPQVPAAGLDTGIAPNTERAEPAGVLAVDGSGRMPATPVADTGQGGVVPLQGVGNEALTTPELPTPQPTQGERDALQKQEAKPTEAVTPVAATTRTTEGKKPLKIGKNALSASVVEIDPDGVVVIVSPDGERNQAQDYDTGDFVKVKPGSSNNEIYQALTKANALQGGHKAFNLEKEAKVKLEATPTEPRTITPKEIGARTVLERTEMVNGERKMVKRDAENLKKLVAAANRDVEKYKALVRCLNA